MFIRPDAKIKHDYAEAEVLDAIRGEYLTDLDLSLTITRHAGTWIFSSVVVDDPALRITGAGNTFAEAWLGAEIGPVNHASCVRLRQLHHNHVSSFDFLQGQTHEGRSLRILTLIEEHRRVCLALKFARRVNSVGVIETLADVMCLHGRPKHIRCDNDPEIISTALRKGVANLDLQLQYIVPGSPWEHSCC